jgi:hypothetical protein
MLRNAYKTYCLWMTFESLCRESNENLSKLLGRGTFSEGGWGAKYKQNQAKYKQSQATDKRNKAKDKQNQTKDKQRQVKIKQPQAKNKQSQAKDQV